MRPVKPRKSGFTIVELLVVVAIMGLLVGILLPALAGVRRRAAKSVETNHLRQLSSAWNLYANSNDGAAVPGYLDEAVQADWNLNLEYPDNTDIPPSVAAPWTWRLFSYLDNNHEVLHGYREEASPDIQSTIAEAADFAVTPAFGYNSYYVGGWYEMENLGGDSVGLPRFWNATVDGAERGLISRQIGTIQRSTELIIFCSSALRAPGVYKKVGPKIDGHHYVAPGQLADTQVWGYPAAAGGGGGPGMSNAAQQGGDQYTVEVFEDEPAPIGRYTNHVALLYADGHVDSQSPLSLLDQRMWIDIASNRTFSHSP